MTVKMSSFDATAIYNMSLYITPLHYYGDESLYDYENNPSASPRATSPPSARRPPSPSAAAPTSLTAMPTASSP